MRALESRLSNLKILDTKLSSSEAMKSFARIA